MRILLRLLALVHLEVLAEVGHAATGLGAFELEVDPAQQDLLGRKAGQRLERLACEWWWNVVVVSRSIGSSSFQGGRGPARKRSVS